MSKRADILMSHLRSLHVETREAKKHRDNLRDNAAAMLIAADATLADFKAERDDALIRLNARLVLDGLPEITLADLKDLP